MKYMLRNKKVTVVGMGRSGIAAAQLLSDEGAVVSILDEKKDVPAPFLSASVQFRSGPWSDKDLFTTDLIVLSPGVSLKKLPTAQLEAMGIPVIGEVELAASLLSAPIIAITGTNGKSTTTMLVGNILKSWGWKVFVGGNLGTPLSEAVSSQWDFIVLELSSFQLETINALRPRIAAVLNITPDHMDRYPDFNAYRQTKWRIFENQSEEDQIVLNLDDPHSIPSRLKGLSTYFSRHKSLKRGVYLHGEEIVTSLRGTEEPICRLDVLHSNRVRHVENFLAAAAISLLCGCSVEGISRAFQAFKGLPHRMEGVREVRGVRYLNDSKGTNVGAVIRSLEGISSPVILIAGGRDKEGDFRPLKNVINKKVRQLILMGEAKEKMAHCFSEHPSVEGVASMEKAVLRAAATARPGEVVLLSPACASFDMFQDYQDRGEAFKNAVRRLPE